MEKKRMKWSDIGRIHKAFNELVEALSVAQPYGVTFPAIELVQKAREEAGGALLFADVENDFMTEEALNKAKTEYLEKRLKKYHDYCKCCPNAHNCGSNDGGIGLGFQGMIQKNICDSTCKAVMDRLGLSETLMNIAVVEITLNKLREEKQEKHNG